MYDDSGKLIGIIDANGKTNVFVHDLNAHTETVYDQTGNPTVYVYDPRGNVTNSVDALGRHTSHTFDDDGNATSVTDPLNHTYTYTYDSYDNQTSVVDPLGHTNLTAYNGNNQPIAMTNALNFVTRFQYDSRGNQTNTVDALNHSYGVVYDQNSKPTAITDPFNRTNATATYDSMGNLASLTDKSSGATTTFAYDANGNQTDSTNLWVNPTNSADVRVVASHSVYDAQGREIHSTDPDGLQSSVTYDADGRQSQLLDEYNRTSGWIYDARGSLIQISFPDGSISRMVYDDAGRMSVTDDKHLPGIVANGTRTTYDEVGQVIMSEKLTNVVINITPVNGIAASAVTSIGGVISTSTYGYDLAGRQIAVTNGFGNVTQYRYDEVGRQTEVIDALNNHTYNYYDEAGRLTTTVNALMQLTRYEYDALGRSVRTIYPDNSFTSVGYDAVGNRVAETNQLGLVTTYEFDVSNHLSALVKPAVFDVESNAVINPRWEFGYDANAQLSLVRDPKRRATTFAYDQLGRMLSHSLPMGQTAGERYDSFGRAYHKIDFKGQTNEFVYDNIGRLSTNQFYAHGVSTPNVAATYAYDSEERIKQIFEPRGTNVFTYDNQGHVLQIASPEGAVNYEYEPIEGRRVRTYTANSDLRYGYDELGRVKTVTVMMRDRQTVNPPEVTTNTYTALGSLQDVYYPNGVHAAYQYDGLMNRLTNLTYTSGSTLLAQYIYASNTNGQWKVATEIQRQVNSTYVTNQLGWFYDNLGRLTNETCGSTLSALSYTNRYIYNLVGNRLWATNIAGGVTTVVGYTYNDNDQLITDGAFTNYYDVNGSLTNRSSAVEANSYAYNLQNRLATAIISRTDSGQSLSETINYVYDYNGRRVRAQWSRNIGGNGTNIFLHEPNSPSGMNQVLEELPAIGATPTVSYTLGSRIVSQGKGGTISHILSDGHGSTRLLTDASGGVAAQYNYDAYGKPVNFQTGVLSPPMTKSLYSGEQLDPDLQQYPLGPRYYNPTVGRFNQIDPFSGNQQNGANLYAYCGNDPVNNADPSGLYEIDVHQYLTAYLAEKVGFDGPIAGQIGAQAQGPDAVVTSATTLDLTRSATYPTLLPPNYENMRLYHFVNRDRLRALADSADTTQQGLKTLGEFFHAQEDTFAHSSKQGYRDFNDYGGEYGGLLGHGPFGNRPDWTWADPNKAMNMAKQVYEDLKDFRKNGRYTGDPADDMATITADPNWDAIKGQVENFVKVTPNVTYTGWFSIATVTFDGYNEKIKHLGSYDIAEAYWRSNPPIYPKVKGSQPGNHAILKGATQLMIHTSDFDTGLSGLGGIAF